MDSALEIYDALRRYKRSRAGKSPQDRLLDYCTRVLGSIEHVHIEFKEKQTAAHPRPEDNDKRNLAKALSGFANSSGGVLVWGIEDKTLSPKPITDVPDFVGSLIQLASQITDPVIPGVDGDWIPSARGSTRIGFGIILIPESPLPPHRVILDNPRVKNHYYFRSGESFEVASHAQLEDMFGRRPKPRLEFIYKQVRRSFDTPVIVGIKNLGRGIAKFPYLEVVLPEPYAVSEWGLDGNGRHGLPKLVQDATTWRKVAFGGGGDMVIYPDSEHWVTAIKITTVQGIPPKTETPFPELAIQYSLCAEGLPMQKGEVRIAGESLRATLMP